MCTKEMEARLLGIENRVDRVTLYLKHVYGTKRFSFGTWTSRQHMIMALEGEDGQGEKRVGYGESILSVNRQDASLEEFREHCLALKGRSLGEAMGILREKRGTWPEYFVEMAELAALDLAGKLLKEPAVRLLGLEGREPVNGVYVILSDDIKDVEEKTKHALATGRAAFIKVKLFGDVDLDQSIIRAVRKYVSRESAYLIGDVNGGYGMPGCDLSLDKVADSLKRLWETGLDACEDPAYIERDAWVELQTRVQPLALIPDYPLRPSRKSIEEIVPGMGEIYNIHPDSAGSALDAVRLAARIEELGAGVMIGDDSLTGPSATIWQQLAIGLGARWVEATEKDGESDYYYSAVKQIPTDSRSNPIEALPCVGFGIYLDEEKLCDVTDGRMSV